MEVGVKVPVFMQGLPTYRGLPVPYTFAVDSRGVPDFKVLSEERVLECIHERRCGMCFRKLDYWICFITGEVSARTRLFKDPAMHEDCARYALAVCPFLNGTHREYKEQTRPLAGVSIETDLNVAVPQKVGLLFTRQYKMTTVGDHWYVKASPARRVDWVETADPV